MYDLINGSDNMFNIEVSGTFAIHVIVQNFFMQMQNLNRLKFLDLSFLCGHLLIDAIWNAPGPLTLFKLKFGFSKLCLKEKISKAICVAIERDQTEVRSIDCEIQPEKGINFFCFLLF